MQSRRANHYTMEPSPKHQYFLKFLFGFNVQPSLRTGGLDTMIFKLEGSPELAGGFVKTLSS